jgi:hypothetical protein
VQAAASIYDEPRAPPIVGRGGSLQRDLARVFIAAVILLVDGEK